MRKFSLVEFQLTSVRITQFMIHQTLRHRNLSCNPAKKGFALRALGPLARLMPGRSIRQTARFPIRSNSECNNKY